MIENKHKITFTNFKRKYFYASIVCFLIAIISFYLEGFDLETNFDIGFWSVVSFAGFVLLIGSLPFPHNSKENMKKMADRYIKR